MWTFWHLLVLSLAVALAVSVDYEQLERDEIIEAVNSEDSTWQAGRNFDVSMTTEYVKKLMGVRKRPEGSRLPAYVDDGEDLQLPKNFDARKKWKKCKSLQQVRDQGDCGSCWAVGAAAAFTDRLCIASKTKFNGHLSGENLLSCCQSCGYGCGGGDPDEAWLYFQNTGIVTGGDYKSKDGCQPYTLPACEHHVHGKRKNCTAYGEDMPKSAKIGEMPTPACQSTCYNKKYKKAYSKDLYKGVYQHKKGEKLGGHAVKVIGWGVEKGTPYWLVANSWNSDWGDKGFFKIKRGNNECNFESDISLGYAKI